MFLRCRNDRKELFVDFDVISRSQLSVSVGFYGVLWAWLNANEACQGRASHFTGSKHTRACEYEENQRLWKLVLFGFGSRTPTLSLAPRVRGGASKLDPRRVSGLFGLHVSACVWKRRRLGSSAAGSDRKQSQGKTIEATVRGLRAGPREISYTSVHKLSLCVPFSPPVSTFPSLLAV